MGLVTAAWCQRVPRVLGRHQLSQDDNVKVANPSPCSRHSNAAANGNSIGSGRVRVDDHCECRYADLLLASPLTAGRTAPRRYLYTPPPTPLVPPHNHVLSSSIHPTRSSRRGSLRHRRDVEAPHRSTHGEDDERREGWWVMFLRVSHSARPSFCRTPFSSILTQSSLQPSRRTVAIWLDSWWKRQFVLVLGPCLFVSLCRPTSLPSSEPRSLGLDLGRLAISVHRGTRSCTRSLFPASRFGISRAGTRTCRRGQPSS